MKLKGRGMLAEDGATQALADVTPAPSEDDVESSYEETKSRKVKKEDLSKAMKNAFPRKLRRTWPSACHGDSEDNEGKGNLWKHCTCFSLNKQTSSKLLLQKNLQQYHKHLAPQTSSIRDSLEHFHHCFSRSPKAKGFALNKEPKLRRTSLEPGQRQDCNRTNGLEKHSALPCCLVWNRAGRATVDVSFQKGTWFRIPCMLSLEQGPVPCHVGFFHPFLGTCHHVDMGKIPKRTGNLLLGFQQLAFQLPILLNFSSWCLQERRCSSMQGICENIQG